MSSYDHKSCIVNRLIGVRDFKCVGKICPPMHRSRDMVHAQWLQMHCQWYLMNMSELITQERIAIGSANLVEGLPSVEPNIHRLSVHSGS